MQHEPVKITSRYDPCKCGCNGRDPWHAQTFTRVVRDQFNRSDSVRLTIGSTTLNPVTRGGIARFPWGREYVAFSPTFGWVRLYGAEAIK